MTSVTAEAQRAAHARWKARRYRLIACGMWQPFVDAQPVREHLERLRTAGMSIRAIEERLGLPRHHFDHLLWGSEGRGPGDRYRTETAELVLGFWPSLDDFPDSARVDAVGTQRRIQALEVRGFSRAAIAQEIGMAVKSFQRTVNADKVTARLARAVRDVYGAWWNEDPCAHGVEEWVADRTRRAAERRGFHGPLAWDDDTIDDPRAVPQIDAPEPVVSEGGNLAARWLMGEAVILDRAARSEVLAHLFEWTNDTTEEIAARLGMTPEAAERKWYRLKEKAEAEGRRLWRRVYVPRERTLNQNEMEEAA